MVMLVLNIGSYGDGSDGGNAGGDDDDDDDDDADDDDKFNCVLSI